MINAVIEIKASHRLTLLTFSALQLYMVEATYRVKEARKQLYSENGRQPDNKEVAEATGLSMKRLTTVLLTPKAPRSLDQKIGIYQNLKPSVRPTSNPAITVYLLKFQPVSILELFYFSF